jgi:hypothetical protein
MKCHAYSLTALSKSVLLGLGSNHSRAVANPRAPSRPTTD